MAAGAGAYGRGPLPSKHAGDRVEGAVIELVPELEYVPDTDAEHWDARTSTLLVPSETVTFGSINLLEVGTAVEIKSAIVVLSDGQRGRFHLQRTQHAKLLEEGGAYLFAVATPTPSRDLLAIRIVPASIVEELVSSWIDAGEGRSDDYAQLSWGRIFGADEIESAEVLA